VRRYFLDNACMWLRDYHFDGLRLDAVHAIVDNSAIHILEEMTEVVNELEVELGRHLILIAESDLNDPRLVRPWDLGGYGIDAQWSDDFHHALHVLLTGEQHSYYAGYQAWDDLKRALREVFVFNGRYSSLRQRRHGRPVLGLPGYHFIGYLQNHDQVGNRATGDRIHQTIGQPAAKVGVAIVFVAPFTPLIFQGEEWGCSTPFQFFTDYQDAALGQAVSQGRKQEFGGDDWNDQPVPDPQSPETFRRSRLDWDERAEPQHAAMLDWYHRLIALRRSQKDLLDGNLENVEVEFDREAGWLLVRRGSLRAACALVDGEVHIPGKVSPGAKILLASDERAALGEEIFLPPYGVLIFQEKTR
jgi:maltooligosyltrehalose trehalohydrolase